MTDSGYIFDIKKFSINDGPGIRTTVFFKGCPLNCLWCHNPESRKIKPQPVESGSYNWSFYSLSDDPCTVGKLKTAEEVMSEIEKDIPFYEESAGGVTFSGGEPLMQAEFLFTLLKECNQRNIHTAVDTSGYAAPDEFELIYDYTDVFLFDLKLLDDDLHKHYVGVSNKIILENLETLTRKGNKVNIRIPLIPSVNDDELTISSTVSYLTKLNIKQINLLPFHNSAASKYQRLSLDNPFRGVKPQTREEMELYKNKFLSTGVPVIIGG